LRRNDPLSMKFNLLFNYSIYFGESILGKLKMDKKNVQKRKI